jgi:hypothetical protein
MTASTTIAMPVPIPALAPTERPAQEAPGAGELVPFVPPGPLVPFVFPAVDPIGVQASFQLSNQSPEEEAILRSNCCM